MRWQDELNINCYNAYSWLSCRRFELLDMLGKLRTTLNVQNQINGVLGKLDPSKIKLHSGFDAPDISMFNSSSPMSTQDTWKSNIGKLIPMTWDGNSSIQCAMFNRSGDCTKQMEWDGPYHYNYEMGYADTSNKTNFDKGWFHAKVKLMHDSDYWPAWWLLGDTQVADKNITPEFDILEEMDKRLKFSVHLNYTSDHFAASISSLSFNTAQWFVMSFHWTDKFLKWYVNGCLVKTFSLDIEGCIPKPHWLIFSDNYQGDVSKLTGKEGMLIDWVVVTDPDVEFW